MKTKNVLSTLLISLTAVSMIACSDSKSDSGSKDFVAQAASNSLESQLEKVNGEIKDLEQTIAQNTSSEDDITEVNLEAKLKQSYSALVDASDKVLVQSTIGNNLSPAHPLMRVLNDAKTELAEDKANLEDFKASMEESRIRAEKAKLNLEDRLLVKETITNNIDIRDFKQTKDYEIGDQKIHATVERKIKRNKEIDMIVNKADYM